MVTDSGLWTFFLRTANQVGKAYDDVMGTISRKYPQARLHGVTVQHMARLGTEVLKDIAFRIGPLTKRDAAEMLREIKGYPLLVGYRGRDAVDLPCLEDMLLRVSDFVEQNPEVKELDLNPVLAYSKGALVVDARFILEETKQT